MKPPLLSLEALDQELIGLYAGRRTRQLADATFTLFKKAVPCLALFMTLRPGEFDLPSYSSEPRFQKHFNRYIEGDHRYDIWMRRSPISPALRVVRHSDHTPIGLLKRSLFYKNVIKPSGCVYGASVVAWRNDTWLSTLTLFRTPAQGDFSDAELKLLEQLQGHYQVAVQRAAELFEASLGEVSLQAFIWSLPTAALVLDWNLKILHHNAAAVQMTLEWEQGRKALRMKTPRQIRVPAEILAEVGRIKGDPETMVRTKASRRRMQPVTRLRSLSQPGLEARISYLPSPSLAVSRGTFVVTLHRESARDDRQSSFESLAKLSKRERQIGMLAINGMTSVQIAKEIGTASGTVRQQLNQIYRKLGIHSRFELISGFSNAWKALS